MQLIHHKFSFNRIFYTSLLMCSLAVSQFIHAAPATFSMNFSPTTIGPGSTSTATFTINNVGQSTGATGLSFVHTMPAGMTIANPSRISTTCINGTLTAPVGSDTVTFSDYRIGAGEHCTVSVDVTSATAGANANTTGDLTSSAGNSGTATATLTVDAGRPGLSMVFSPSTINQGAISKLTFNIDNTLNGNLAKFLNLTNDLPTGLTVSSEPNIVNTCSGVVLATAGSNDISFENQLLGDGVSVAAGTTCTVSVDVIAASSGQYVNVSSELTQNYSISSGWAAASLNVINPFLNANFPAAVSAGESVTLTFSLNNTDRRNSAQNIEFTNDLNATLNGLTATSLPANGFCGTGSSISGSSLLTITGANLASGDSCSFDVTVQVPSNAANGVYTNTTSVVDLTLGSATTKPALSHTLQVTSAPQLSMAFVEGLVGAGEDVTARFTITNSDVASNLTDLKFTMSVNQPYAGMTIKTLPAANSCGVGSSFETISPELDVFAFSMTSGAVTAGGNCTFDVILTLPNDGISGSFLYTTSPITGNVAGNAVTGAKAKTNLVTIAAPRLNIGIDGRSSAPGDIVNAELTLNYSEDSTADVSGIAFTIDLDSALSGLTMVTPVTSDICGVGSSLSGSSILTLSGGNLAASQQCSFSVALQIPTNTAPTSFTLTSSPVTATIAGRAVNSRFAVTSHIVTGLSMTTSFLSSPVLAGDKVTMRYEISNAVSALAASDIAFTKSLSSSLSSLVASELPTEPCGVGSSLTGTTFLNFVGGSLAPGASCSFDVVLDVPNSASPSVYYFSTSDVAATVNGFNTTTPSVSAALFVDSLETNISAISPSISYVSPLSIAIDFSRAVTGFVPADLQVTNGSVSELNGAGLNYTAVIIPNVHGVVTITLPANSVDDAVSPTMKNVAQSLTMNYITAPANVAVTSPVAAISTVGTSYDISGTHTINASRVFLYADKDNNGVADNANALASDTVVGGLWSLTAPLSPQVVNNFVVAWEDRVNLVNQVVNVPTITEITPNYAPVIGGVSSTSVNEDDTYSFVPTLTDQNSNDTHQFSIANKPSWALFDVNTGALSGTPLNDDVGIDSDIIITVTDSSGLSDALAPFNLSVINTNDAPTANPDSVFVNNGNAVEINVLANDVDIDNDTFVIIGATTDIGTVEFSDTLLTYQPIAGFSGTVLVTYVIRDSVGETASATVTIEVTLDTSSIPTITPPVDITIDSTGLFTFVELGTATATDNKGNNLAVVSDSAPYFRPGVHHVVWKAVDAAGNEATTTQSVKVIPQISLQKDQITVEGSTAMISVILNGDAVEYPVTVAYSVSGSASIDGSDHDLASGEFIIENSQSEASIEINIVDDDISEGPENIVVTIADPVNAVLGTKSNHIINVFEGNVAPEVTLTAMQAGKKTKVVSQVDGVVIVNASIIDLNIDDQHDVSWLDSDSELVDTDTKDNTFTFDPSAISAGVYQLQIAVDDGERISRDSIKLRILETLPTLTSDDSDKDGISDSDEGIGDEDNDGIPNYLDSINLPINILQEEEIQDTAFLMETEPGLLLTIGELAFRVDQANAQVSTDNIVTHNGEEIGLDSDYEYNSGIFDFSIKGLSIAGQSVSTVISQLKPIPVNAVYRKATDSGWENFVSTINNTVKSAPGAEGFCPSPGDAAYVDGLTQGHWCVELTIEDGGPNDADGMLNKSIEDPGGVATSANRVPVTVGDLASVTQGNTVIINVLANDSDADGDVIVVVSASAQSGSVTINDDHTLSYQALATFKGEDTIAYTIADTSGAQATGEVVVTVNAVVEPTTPKKSGGNMNVFMLLILALGLLHMSVVQRTY